MKNVILCAYNLIGCEVLSLLIEKNFNVFVYTHKSPYHIPNLIEFCTKNKIPFTTDKIKIENIPFKPDIICSLYYRFIIPVEVINYCNGRIFNLHPSILPDYKGCSSITWAIINNEEFTGYTYHYIDSKIDTGDIISQKKIKINAFDNQVTLYYKVMIEALKDFTNVFNFVIENRKGIPQTQDGKYYKRGAPFGGEIDEKWNFEKTERFIRAMIHPPYPLAQFNNEAVQSFDSYLKLINAK